jgi:hypothetical protein
MLRVSSETLPYGRTDFDPRIINTALRSARKAPKKILGQLLRGRAEAWAGRAGHQQNVASLALPIVVNTPKWLIDGLRKAGMPEE